MFNVSGNVANSSAQNTLFDIATAKLVLQGTGEHQFTWSGADFGDNAAGSTNNFAMGTLELQAGGSFDLLDGNATPGVGLYLETLQLGGGVSPSR